MTRPDSRQPLGDLCPRQSAEQRYCSAYLHSALTETQGKGDVTACELAHLPSCTLKDTSSSSALEKATRMVPPPAASTRWSESRCESRVHDGEEINGIMFKGMFTQASDWLTPLEAGHRAHPASASLDRKGSEGTGGEGWGVRSHAGPMLVPC